MQKDSPQAAQVYNHGARLTAHPHYTAETAANRTSIVPVAGTNSYYEASRQMAREPPPAHRSMVAHSVVAPPLPPPPSVAVPHQPSGNAAFITTGLPPTSAIQTAIIPHPPAVMHSKLLEREQQLQREKDQMLPRTGGKLLYYTYKLSFILQLPNL